MRLSKKQTGVLESWLSDNIFNPYPEKTEKTRLAKATGLFVRQVQSWFSRTRQRKLAHPCAVAGDQSKPDLQANASRSSDICFSLLQLSLETAPTSQQGSDGNVSPISLQRKATTGSMRSKLAAAKEVHGHDSTDVREWLKALPQSFDHEQRISPLTSTASVALSRSAKNSKSVDPVILPDSFQPALLQHQTLLDFLMILEKKLTPTMSVHTMMPLTPKMSCRTEAVILVDARGRLAALTLAALLVRHAVTLPLDVAEDDDDPLENLLRSAKISMLLRSAKTRMRLHTHVHSVNLSSIGNIPGNATRSRFMYHKQSGSAAILTSIKHFGHWI